MVVAGACVSPGVVLAVSVGVVGGRTERDVCSDRKPRTRRGRWSNNLVVPDASHVYSRTDRQRPLLAWWYNTSHAPGQ